ncbi:uncharacterized protein LOC110861438 [Folsomia candida]|uniref:uncharacterized protein LOC110861438 n=1 Tax=Folsomia candida TaxID=158441 RepID=UPI001604B64D|nr:uncharacterized protein LOC110861438 [Folsomia candida]
MFKLIVFCLLFTVLFTASQITEWVTEPYHDEDFKFVTNLPSYYRARCKNSMHCGEEPGLICATDKVCRCRTHELWYSVTKKACIASNGDRCKFGAELNSEKQEILECPKASVCNETGFCSCAPGYFENPERFEVPYSYGTSFTAHKGVCVGKVDVECQVEANYKYGSDGPQLDNVYCMEDAKCVGRTCWCQDNLVKTRDQLCGRKYGKEYSMTKPCQDNLVCTRVQGNSSMRCLCRNQDMQIYDDTVAKYGSCRGLVGTPCDPEDTNSCVVGAQCEPTAEKHGIPYRCECKLGNIRNSDKKCEILHGNTCDPSSAHEHCDKLANLTCRIVPQMNKERNVTEIGAVCSCRNLDDLYEPQLRKCVSAFGVSCRSMEDCPLYANCMKSSPNEDGLCAFNGTQAFSD